MKKPLQHGRYNLDVGSDSVCDPMQKRNNILWIVEHFIVKRTVCMRLEAQPWQCVTELPWASEWRPREEKASTFL